MSQNKFYLQNYKLFTNSIITARNRNYHFFYDLDLLRADSSQIIRYENDCPAYLFLALNSNLGHFLLKAFFVFIIFSGEI